MPGLNKKKRKLLELQITLCMHPKGGVDIIMLKFNTHKNVIKYYEMCTKSSMCEQSLGKVLI